MAWPDELGLGEPFSDPAVEVFGLRNAVFALGHTFLEVVFPIAEDTSAGRLLARRGGDCGYCSCSRSPMFRRRCRAAPLAVAGTTVAVADAESVARCWRSILGTPPPGLDLVTDPDEPRITEIALTGAAPRVVEFERVRVVVRAE